jgi:hypothetical protein
MAKVTREDKAVMEVYIKEQDFFKPDTPKTIRRAFVSMMEKGMSDSEALDIIEEIVSAIKDEYGE